LETPREAYRLAKQNNGAPGIDGVTFAAIETKGLEAWLQQLRAELRPYYPPKLKQRTALQRKLKDIFRRFDCQPVGRVVQLINPMVRAGQIALPSATPVAALGLPETGWRRRCDGI
jgi:hypothetical protein